MKTYEVTIRATITKTYTVTAANEIKATEAAHEIFTVECDETEEHYTQDVLDVYEAKQTTN